jgi:hypothetical protein
MNSIDVVSLKRTVDELVGMPEEEIKKLAAKQLKWGRKMLERERAKRGLQRVQ